ncbi:carboxylesterase/lipase family protein [Sabulicella glaciei]|uniref:Carboxylic ester hydrolase n=1 Tax=Sabulicella glaciei TaxID=2984948 RepID=A0ABT3NQY3_9PROT|nr:carboxylesterase family protein [Roseococcus sp. MDT2-1-1]MCW8084565.1 carboxylesterase family protein [Roseococcus sp. MDT2-1-1]
MRLLLPLLGLAGALFAAPVLSQPVIATEGGALRGVSRDGIAEYRGIPYAAAPAGARRWAAPEAPSPWTGTRDAAEFGPACPQVARYGLTEASDAEDCLQLNVAVPEGGATGPKPVLVWIHGGAFVGGSSSLYPLAPLARAGDLIVVSLNYRLGVFGFLSHPALPAATNGAVALEDQRAALRWVQRNIHAFGGDPGNVTLAGESAGAGSVCMQVLTPERAEGLFQKAIIQSAGCAFHLRSAEENEALGQRIATAVGCGDAATAAECLRGKDVNALLDAANTAAGSDLIAFAPSFGSPALPRQSADSLESGRFLPVPTLFGGTRDELRLYVAYDIQAGARITAETYSDGLRRAYGTNADAVAAAYPSDHFGPAPATLGSVMTEFHPTVGINHCIYLRTAELLARRARVHRFEFADRTAPMLGVALPATPDPGFDLGAAHSSDLNYIFPRFSNTRAINGPDLAGASRQLADIMVAYWTSFARTGTPRAPGAPEWGTDQTLRFEAGRITPINPESEHNCGFWRRLYPDLLGG